MEKVKNPLTKLISLPEAKRDEKWEVEFLEAVPSAKVTLESETPIKGPDGWPYLQLKSAPDGEEGEPILSVVRWASEKGVGLVLNSHKEVPDYVFTYGMIWNFVESGKFCNLDQMERPTEDYVLTEGQEIYVAAVTEAFVPVYVRDILIQFFAQQEVEQPKWTLLSDNKKDYDLVFSIESLGSPEEAEFEGILEAISWFFPNHYVLSLLSETTLEGFRELSFVGEEKPTLH